jgi:transposase
MGLEGRVGQFRFLSGIGMPLQFVEGLTDRQAADAVRARLDWKYALGLDLDDPGFDASVLSEFRARLLGDGQAERLLGLMLDRLRERGLL